MHPLPRWVSFIAALALGRAAAGAQVTPDSVLVQRLDSLVVARMAKEHIIGGTLALVRDGAILTRGYGVVDPQRRVPVDPERTPFGISSISKTFTAAAVLQLVERGRLGLDDSVARHVPDIPLRDYAGRPVRVRDLLTHSGGFDDAAIGLAARTADAVAPLAPWLREEMPPQVRPPGSVTSYSNHGFALAGLLVEQVSGVPFARYLRDNLLDPLEMHHSGFEQPLLGDLEAARARPYAASGGELREIPRIYFNDVPASGMYTTAGDMGRFMQFLLDESADTPSPESVLSGASLDAMMARQFANHPAVTGVGFGMRELRSSGPMAFEQGGDWQDYSSDLIVSPALGTGLFVAFSGEEGSGIGGELWQAIIAADASPAPAGEEMADSASGDSTTAAGLRVDGLAGRYRASRYSRHSIAKLGVLIGAVREFAVTSRRGELHLSGRRLEPVEPEVFRRADTKTLVAFRRAASGRGTHLFFENSPYVAYERVPWYGVPAVHQALFAVVIGVAIWGAVFSFRSRRSASGRSRAWRTMRVATPAFEAVGLVLLLGVGATLAATDLWEFQYGLPNLVRWLLRVAPVAIGLVAVAAVATALVVARQEGPMRYRAIHLVRSVAGIVLAALLLYWRFVP